MTNEQRGSVRHAERYRQGYDHSGWASVLPRRITPSDIDVVFDDYLHGRQLFCEFTSRDLVWTDKPPGQRMLYERLLKSGSPASACVLCSHDVPAESLINTTQHVTSFHVMRYTPKGIVFSPGDHQTFDGSLWVDFVKSFYGLENGFGTWSDLTW